MITFLHRLKLAWMILQGKAWSMSFWIASKGDIYVNGEPIEKDKWTHFSLTVQGG